MAQVDLRKVSMLTNNQLTEQLRAIIVKEKNLGAELLLYLSEVDRRRLYRQQACTSMFEFCVTRLGFSEDVAYKRVTVARLLRQFPVIYEFLSTGKVHLSALTTIGAHLTQENHREWLLLACGKSKRQIEQLIASRFPRPDVVAGIRKIPERATSGSGDNGQVTADPYEASRSGASLRDDPSNADSYEASRSGAFLRDALSNEVPSRVSSSHAQVAAGTQLGGGPDNSTLAVRAAKVEPLSDHSYRVVFTASEGLKSKLDRANELLSHTLARTNLPGLIERALDLLIEREERRRLGAKAKSDGSAKEGRNEKQSKLCCEAPRARRGHARHIPANVRRTVWDRDGGQCTFVDDAGNRCEARHFIQFDHREPHAFGGAPTVENLRLRCAAHNAFAAEEVFGRLRGSAAPGEPAASGRGSAESFGESQR